MSAVVAHHVGYLHLLCILMHRAALLTSSSNPYMCCVNRCESVRHITDNHMESMLGMLDTDQAIWQKVSESKVDLCHVLLLRLDSVIIAHHCTGDSVSPTF